MYTNTRIETARTKRFQIRLSSINHSLLLLFYSSWFFCVAPFFLTQVRTCLLLPFAYKNICSFSLTYPLTYFVWKLRLCDRAKKKEKVVRTHETNKKFFFYLVKPFLFSIENSERQEKGFFLFDKLNPHAHIRTYTIYISIFELNALKLHHAHDVYFFLRLFAIHFSPIIISAFVWAFSLFCFFLLACSRSIVRLLRLFGATQNRCVES